MFIIQFMLLSATLRIDAPVMVAAQGTVSQSGTEFTPYWGPRVGYVNNADDGQFWGVDSALMAGYRREGTPEVEIVMMPLVAEGRLLGGWHTKKAYSLMGIYLFSGAHLGATWVSQTVLDVHRASPQPAWAVLAGSGVEIGIGPILGRIELGAGFRNLRFELLGSAGIGGQF